MKLVAKEHSLALAKSGSSKHLLHDLVGYQTRPWHNGIDGSESLAFCRQDAIGLDDPPAVCRLDWRS